MYRLSALKPDHSRKPSMRAQKYKKRAGAYEKQNQALYQNPKSQSLNTGAEIQEKGSGLREAESGFASDCQLARGSHQITQCYLGRCETRSKSRFGFLKLCARCPAPMIMTKVNHDVGVK